jgi:dCMP deaminase
MIKNWDEYFGKLTLLTSQKSEDQSTQCGSIIVTPTNEVVTTGYNGFPRGIKDTPERQERPIKYKYFEHAERNAIYNAARLGSSTLGKILWVTGVPCADCARAIIQAGIIEVVAQIRPDADAEFIARWKESTDFTIALFEEAGVKLRRFTV